MARAPSSGSPGSSPKCAQIAWQLKKRYIQDEELQWGCNSGKNDDGGRVQHRGASLQEIREWIEAGRR